MKRLILPLFALLFVVSILRADDILSGGAAGTPIKGSWSSTATWFGGVIPTSADNVTITDGDTVYIDVTCQVVDLTVGGGTSGALIFASTNPANITVTGSILVNAGGTFRCTGSSSGTSNIDSIFVYGNFTNNGYCLDFRTGTAGQVGVAYVIFTGSGNSTLKSIGAYNSTQNEFNGITINKSGKGKLTLQSDIFLAGGSSADLTTTSYLDLRHGLIYTGNYCLVARSTASNTQIPPSIENYSSQSYVVGCVGRGMSSSSVAVREFPLGDAKAYRPIKVHNATVGGATGHNLRVRLVTGDGNASDSIASSAIDKITTLRYYKLTYDKSTETGTYPNMSFDKFNLSYGSGDGISEGNSNLRVAYTTDSLVNWKSMGQVVAKDTTKFTDPPSYWRVDSLPQALWDTLYSPGKSMFVALARAAGTSENTLGVGVYKEQIPSIYSLAQNYPNPFNPTTTIEFTVPTRSHIVLEIFNVLGQAVARLVDEERPAGSYKVQYDGSGLSSGVYIYRVSSGSTILSKSMVLVK
jgi:hypothetical protein